MARDLPPAAAGIKLDRGVVPAPPPAAAPEIGAVETPAETSKSPRSAAGPRPAGKTRQRPAQGRPGATQPEAHPRPGGLSRQETARWEHWLNATAGKLGKTVTGSTGAAAAAEAWQGAVADARDAGVGDFPIQAAAMRALADLPAGMARVVAALADVPEIQRAVVAAVVAAAEDEEAWLHQ